VDKGDKIAMKHRAGKFGVDTPMWRRAKAQAALEGISLKDFIGQAIEFYIKHLEARHQREVVAETKRKAS
jgi:hypothetical protein